MNWTTELRYQKYENWSTDYQQALQQQVKQSQWRLHYHIQPNQGLLNDPNGFSYFNHQWHLFLPILSNGPGSRRQIMAPSRFR